MGKRQLSNEDIFAKINSFSSENQSDSSISNEDIFAKINSFNDTTESDATPKVVKKKESTASFGQASSTDSGFKLGYDPFSTFGLSTAKFVSSEFDKQRKAPKKQLTAEEIQQMEEDRNAKAKSYTSTLDKMVEMQKGTPNAMIGGASMGSGSYASFAEHNKTKVGAETTSGLADAYKYILGAESFLETGVRQGINYLNKKFGDMSDAISEKLFGDKTSSPNKPENLVSETPFLQKQVEYLQNYQDAANAYIKKERGLSAVDAQKNVTDFLAEGRIGDAIEEGVFQALHAAPVSAITMGAGLGLSAAIKGSSLAVPLAFGGVSPMAAGTFVASTATGLGANASEALTTDDKQISGAEFLTIPIKGMIEGLTEAWGLSDVKAFNTITQGMRGMTRNQIADAVVRTPRQAVKKILGGAFEEGMEEVYATLGDFAVDAIASGKFDPKALDKLGSDLVNSFFVGSISGGGMVSGSAAMSLAANSITASEKKAIRQLQEVANSADASEEVKNAAKQKIDEITAKMAQFALNDAKAVASIEDVDDRGKAIRLLSEVDMLTDKKNSNQVMTSDEAKAASLGIRINGTTIDEALGKELDGQIQEKLDVVNTLISKSNEAKALRARNAAEESLKELKEKGNKFVEESNLFRSFTENTESLRDRMSRMQDIDIKELANSTNLLYDLIDSIHKDETLSKEEKMFAAQRVLSEINAIEQYEGATKDGVLLQETGEEVQSDAQKKAIKNSIASIVQNARFHGEELFVRNEQGRKVTLTASVNEKGEVVLTPNKARYEINKETGKRELVQQESQILTKDLKLGKVRYNTNGDFVSAEIIDSKNNTTYNTSSQNLAEYLYASKSKNAIIQSSNAAYEVGDLIEFDMTNNVVNRLTPDQRTRLRNQTKLLKSVNPNAKMIVFADAKAMAKHLMSKGVKMKTAYKIAKTSYGLNYSGEEVLLNAEHYSNITPTAAHEVFHTVLHNIAKNNPVQFKNMASKVIKYLYQSDIDELKNFARLYMLDEKGVMLPNERINLEKVGEEFLVELAAIIGSDADFKFKRGFLQPIMNFINEFLHAVANKLNSQTLRDFADNVSKEYADDEKILRFFEAYKESIRTGKELDMSLLGELEAQTDVVDNSEAFKRLVLGDRYEGFVEAVQLPKEIDSALYDDGDGILLRQIGRYDFPKGTAYNLAEVPVMSLNEAVRKNNGRVLIITSDATGYGVDSLGHPILGGYAYSMIEQNVKDGIGYASVSASTASAALTSARNQFGEGTVTVLIMIQNPSTTINNSYGAKYFGRFLKSVAQNHPEQLDNLKESIIDLFSKNKDIIKSFKEKSSKKVSDSEGAVSQKELDIRKKNLYELIRSANENLDEEKFAEEFVKDTTFDARKAILQAVIIKNQRTLANKSNTPVYKSLSKEYGFTIEDFLKEFGDKSFLTDKIIRDDIGGFVVGGFEVDIKDKDTNISETNEVQDKGITHPLFNGKMIGHSHFNLDGIYSVNDNFAKYNELHSKLVEDEETLKKINKAVRKMFPDRKSYESEYKNVADKELGYKHLKPTQKVKFKNEVAKKNGWLEYYVPNVAVEVARGTGFKIKSPSIPAEMAQDDFAQMTIEDEIANISDGSDFVPQFISQRRLYHGSPHMIEKFSTDKVGTGEGAQAYGWGLYFTEDINIAKSYALSNQGNRLNNAGYLSFLDDNLRKKAINLLNSQYTTLDKWKSFLEQNKGFLGLKIPKSKRQELYNAFGQRHLYSVNVNESNSAGFYDGVWIDWHKEVDLKLKNEVLQNINKVKRLYEKKFGSVLGNSSKVNYDKMSKAEAFQVAGYFTLLAMENSLTPRQFTANYDKTGADFYNDVTTRFMHFLRGSELSKTLKASDYQRYASLILSSIGVDGIRVPTFFLTGGRGDGKYNYVVFDEEAISIERRDVWKQRKVDVSTPLTASENAVKNKKRSNWWSFAKAFKQSVDVSLFERNARLGDALTDSGMMMSFMMLHNKAGAIEYANLKFSKLYNEIFSGLSETDIKYVSSIALMERTLAIDKNFDSRGKARPFHGKITQFTTSTNPKYWNEIPLTSESARRNLDKMARTLPNFDDLNNRATKIFEAFSAQLKRRYDNGLIDKDTYEMFKNYNYVPRKFLQHMFEDSYSFVDRYGKMIIAEEANAPSYISRGGTILNEKDIKTIKEGQGEGDTRAEDYLFSDMGELLRGYMMTTEIRIATNNFMKQLAKDKALADYGFVKEANYERYANGIIKLNKDGAPKYVGADNGFTNLMYRERGQVKVLQLKNELVDELKESTLKGFRDSLNSNMFLKYGVMPILTLPSKLLRMTATGVNPSFVTSNLPLDSLQQVFATNIHSGNVFEQVLSAGGGTIDIMNQLLLAKAGIIDGTDLNQLLLDYAEDGGLMMSLTDEAFDNDKSKVATKAVEILSLLGNMSEIASKLNAYQAVRERLELDYYNKNGYEAVGGDLKDIRIQAAYSARSAMDFYRGGNLTKIFDMVSPYLNVMFQTTKISYLYAKNNPAEFVNKLFQSSLGTMALTMYNLLVAGDDYDNDDVQMDLTDAIVIFYPFKNADGTRNYIKIQAPSFVKTQLNLSMRLTEQYYHRFVTGDIAKAEKGLDNWKKQMARSVQFGALNYIPTVAKIPIEYSSNYNFFKGRPIYDSKGNKATTSGAEGLNDPKVSYMLKKIGAYADSHIGANHIFSPALMQNALNTVLVPQSTLVAMGTALADNVTKSIAMNASKDPASFRNKYLDGQYSVTGTFFNSFKDRVVKKTDPKVVYGDDSYKNLDKVENTDNLYRRNRLEQLIEQGASPEKMISTVTKEFGSGFEQSTIKYYLASKKKIALKYPDLLNSDYFPIMYSTDDVSRGQKFGQFVKLHPELNPNSVASDLIMLGSFSNSIKQNEFFKNLK